MREVFERDLRHVLVTLENLLRGKANHIDYTLAVKYFIDTWAPPDGLDPSLLPRCLNEDKNKFTQYELPI